VRIGVRSAETPNLGEMDEGGAKVCIIADDCTWGEQCLKVLSPRPAHGSVRLPASEWWDAAAAGRACFLGKSFGHVCLSLIKLSPAQCPRRASIVQCHGHSFRICPGSCSIRLAEPDVRGLIVHPPTCTLVTS
jgi:hypothetical protein